MRMQPHLLLTLGIGTSIGAGTVLSADALLSDAHAGPVELPADFNPTRSLAPLVEELSPAVVNIEVSRTVDGDQLDALREMLPPGIALPEGMDAPRVQEGAGSGFFISPDGYLLTNHHVVAGGDMVTVRLQDERELAGRVIGSDENLDVALVKVDPEAPLPYVELGDSDAARVGDWVVAIGNPFGLSHSVTVGIISAKGRVLGAGPYDDFIQTDAAINPGNSGGPLFNLSGEVVGINTAIDARAQGVGFSVPANEIQRIVEDLKDDGRVSRGWLGVGLSNEDGAVISSVYPDTPAADAGLQAGDRIVSVDGKDVEDSDALVRAIGHYRAGDDLRLSIERAGRAQRVKVTLGERPSQQALRSGEFRVSPEAAPAPPQRDAPPKLGVALRMAPDLGLGAEGVVVESVRDGMPADGLLEAGDLLLKVNGQPVETPADVAAALGRAGDRLSVVVARGDEERLVVIPLR